jgi:multidrug efflux pump subunit AcrA (membrane-fusion protein)
MKNVAHQVGGSYRWLAIAICIFYFAGCGGGSKDTEPSVAVEIATAKRMPISQIISSEAVLSPIQQAALSPKISAPVRKFYVTRGAKVHRGQLLVTLENRDLAAVAVENQGAYQQAEANYATTTSSSLPEEFQKAELDARSSKQALDAQQNLYDNRRALYKEGALPRKDLDQAEVALAQARTQYELAQQHLKALQAGGKQQRFKAAGGELTAAKGRYLGAEAQLQYSELRSPIDGVVTDRSLYEGEVAPAGSPVITVMDVSQVIAKAHIPQTEAVLLHPGDPATLVVPGLDASVAGKVKVVSPALDPNSTTVEIWVQAPNPNGDLKPGTTVRLSMVARTVPGAVVVPSAAILTDASGKKSVMVVGTDSRAHDREVQTGIQQGDLVQITSGVQPGEQVIRSGGYGLSDNTKVSTSTPAAQSGASAKD